MNNGLASDQAGEDADRQPVDAVKMACSQGIAKPPAPATRLLDLYLVTLIFILRIARKHLAFINDFE